MQEFLQIKRKEEKRPKRPENEKHLKQWEDGEPSKGSRAGESLKRWGIRLRIPLWILLGIVLLLFAVSRFLWISSGGEKAAYTAPSSPRQDVSQILEGALPESGLESETPSLSPEQYRLLSQQTGLSSIALDDLLQEGQPGIQKILQCQENRYQKVKISRNKIGIVTWEEQLCNSDGSRAQGFFFPDLKKGDILVSRNDYTLGWRHGHAGIVVDPSAGVTLESVYMGKPSCFQFVRKWEGYPSVTLLRVKDADRITKDGHRLGDLVADYAKEHMLGVPYSLFAGFPFKSFQPFKPVKTTQCAHLVWACWKHFGYDLVPDDGWAITPKQIRDSKSLNLIQAFGTSDFNNFQSPQS